MDIEKIRESMYIKEDKSGQYMLQQEWLRGILRGVMLSIV
mgnify:CR=1 FL=1